MDGFICMFNKTCREEKSKEIVHSMNKEEKAYYEIYSQGNLNSNIEK